VDFVGSLLRPDYLLRARKQFKQGDLALNEFKRMEDRAVREAVELQEEAGLPVVTDGEMRRESFQSKFVRKVEGFSRADRDAFLWGNWRSDRYGDENRDRPDNLAIERPLTKTSPIFLEEFLTLRILTDRVPKLTVPSPGLFLNFWNDGDSSVYSHVEEFMNDVIAIYREEIKQLIDTGLRYVQIDAPHYPLLIDDQYRSFYTDEKNGIEGVLDQWIGWDNRVIEGLDEATIGMHLCRGNQGSRWLAEGSYEPLAERLFNGLTVDRFLLEYDDERSGSYRPLEYMPAGNRTFLGLISTKHAELEDVDAVRKEVDEASEFHPKSELGLSTQCGFASSTMGNKLTIADQEKKLGRLVEAADRIWPA
jgi:5-methyltetrahydropteroyltriglutamate--homocysteine methyltransferase